MPIAPHRTHPYRLEAVLILHRKCHWTVPVPGLVALAASASSSLILSIASAIDAESLFSTPKRAVAGPICCRWRLRSVGFGGAHESSRAFAHMIAGVAAQNGRIAIWPQKTTLLDKGAGRSRGNQKSVAAIRSNPTDAATAATATTF